MSDTKKVIQLKVRAEDYWTT